MNLKTWKQRARQLSAQTYALYLAYRHPRTPSYAKVFAALVVGYVFSPIDPIPDWIPGVGLLDEILLALVGGRDQARVYPVARQLGSAPEFVTTALDPVGHLLRRRDHD